jgi:sulfate adenylyltransferase subunit 1
MTLTSVPTHDLLRFATAGSVDDGKSTLVGRLLHDTKSILADTMASVERASIAKGLDTTDLALLTDGLRAEREQGITIDVAYRYFSTATRSYVLADTPGHVEYTRNMVTGASTAELALVLVDARHGVVEQTRRHAAAAALLGVRHLVLAVNKMDLIGFDEATFDRIRTDFAAVATQLQVAHVVTIPLSALLGDNVVERSTSMPWYDGPTLLEHLESVPVGADPSLQPLRFPVQYVIRPRSDEHHDHRGYAGKVAHGIVRVGDTVVMQTSGRQTTILAIDGLSGPLQFAVAAQSVSLRLADDLDVSRGDVIVSVTDVPQITTDLLGQVCVLSDKPLTAGDRVLLRHGTRTIRARITAVTGRLNLSTLEEAPYDGPLSVNDIGSVQLRLAEPVGIDSYERLRCTGAFLLVDGQNGATLAAGMAVVDRCQQH